MIFLNGFNSPFMDVVMHYISEPWPWIPVFILVLYYVFKIYGVKGTGIFLLAVGLCILLNDRISVMGFKDVFQRYRPCRNGEIGDLIHTYDNKCGGKYGFVSSHAANFFGLATLFTMVLRDQFKQVYIWMFLWAALIGYSRIYLGVHYPFDIVGGAMLGVFLGWITGLLFRYFNSKYNLD